MSLTTPCIGLADEGNQTGAEDLFGGGGGYFHPYVATTGMYDDNVYRTAANEVGDYATVLSPGIWMALPGTRERKLNLNTSTLTPGGLGLVEDRGESFQRFQGFLHYGADLTRFQEEDSNDTDDQRIDALLQYNLKGGLTFEVLDIYLDGHDERGEGAFGDLDTYKSNLLGGRVTYDLGSRFRVRGEYGHFTVNYDDNDKSYRDRIDDKYATYLYYKLSGKSSIFAEYDLVDIKYDQLADYDSKENTIWGGFRWRLSDKTIGEIKAGNLTKKYSLDSMDEQSDFVVKGWLDYELTGKSKIRLTAARMVEEPDSHASHASIDNQVRTAFIHDLTSKIQTTAEVGYGKVSYEGEYYYNGVSGEREDDKYSGKLLIDYRIQNWLGVKASYVYLDRQSSFSDLSYTDNRYLLSLSLSM